MNIWDDDWGEQAEDWSGGGGVAKPLVPAGPQLGATLYELEHGNFMIFHFHHGSEELLVVLRGRPTLRTLAGERQLEEGPPAPTERTRSATTRARPCATSSPASACRRRSSSTRT